MEGEADREVLARAFQEYGSVLSEFIGEIFEVTTLLMYTLSEIREYYKSNISQASQGQVLVPPAIDSLCIVPICIDPTKGKNNIETLEKQEQLAYESWLIRIYTTWESSYRGRMKNILKSVGNENTIHPETVAMGDLRRMRNDVVHARIASKDHTGKCEVLTWFEVGDKMSFNIYHVLDFLNQIGGLSKVEFSGSILRTWHLRESRESLLQNLDHKIISLRSWSDGEPQVPYVSVVFDNGIFGSGPFLPHSDGPISLADISPEAKRRMYIACIEEIWFGTGAAGPGAWGPAFRFAR